MEKLQTAEYRHSRPCYIPQLTAAMSLSTTFVVAAASDDMGDLLARRGNVCFVSGTRNGVKLDAQF